MSKLLQAARETAVVYLGRRHRWSIGLYAGPSPLDLKPIPGLANPVLSARQVTDIDARFVADPFLVREQGAWYMFFEVLNRSTGLGEIALATSPDARRWHYQQRVLSEPIHLSYPYVFQWEGSHYLVPETFQDAAVSLYRAERFPGLWSRIQTLITGRPFVDASVFRFAERWWMLVSDVRNEDLYLYQAAGLLGPWLEHPASPVVRGEAQRARPGGRVLAVDGRLFRFGQDNRKHYGRQVYAYEITDLTPTRYSERPASSRPVLAPGGIGWRRHAMHHLDAHCLGPGEWIACVDGEGNPAFPG